MSFTAVILPILAALSIAEEKFLKLEDAWQTINPKQQVLIERYWPFKAQLAKLLPEELRSMASLNIAEINKFLKDNGFDIQLKDRPNFDVDGHPEHFAVASILKIMLMWKKPGTETILKTDAGSYPAVSMRVERGAEFSIVRSLNGGEVLMMKAENGDSVYMQLHENSIHGNEPLREFELIEYGKQLVSQEHIDLTYNYDAAVFPMVDLNQEVDISWLRGLTKSQYSIDQALQQTKFQMNEKGAAAQSAVAIVGVFTTSHLDQKKPIFKIDKPFYLWIIRDGVCMPLFAAYIDTCDWKKPAKLG